jgi:site-specific recombinase XerD
LRNAVVRAENAKTRTSRTVPFSPHTAEAVHTLIRARHPEWENDIPVFCSCESTPLTRHSWGDRLELYSKQLGVKICPYDLRHTFALMFLRQGAHAFALQNMLGHTDMSMTRRYVNLTSIDLQQTHQYASPVKNLLLDKKPSRRGSL